MKTAFVVAPRSLRCWQRCPTTRTPRWTPRTTAHGRRRQSSALGRWRHTRRTKPYGDRRNLHRGRGQASLRSLGRAVTAAHASGVAPLLAAAGADGVDAATLSFLTVHALDDRRKEEEEAAPRKKEALLAVSLELDALWLVPFERRTAQEDARVCELEKLLIRLDCALSPSRRKRKKRSKRKLPKSSSPRFSRGVRIRRCGLCLRLLLAAVQLP